MHLDCASHNNLHLWPLIALNSLYRHSSAWLVGLTTKELLPTCSPADLYIICVYSFIDSVSLQDKSVYYNICLKLIKCQLYIGSWLASCILSTLLSLHYQLLLHNYTFSPSLLPMHLKDNESFERVQHSAIYFGPSTIQEAMLNLPGSSDGCI